MIVSDSSGKINLYCKGLIECPTTLSPLSMMQQGHLSSIQTVTRSCLQIEQIQGCISRLEMASIFFFSRFVFSSMYNHSKTTGRPRAKKTSIVRTGTLKIKRDTPNSTVPMPSIRSQRFVKLSIRLCSLI